MYTHTHSDTCWHLHLPMQTSHLPPLLAGGVCNNIMLALNKCSVSHCSYVLCLCSHRSVCMYVCVCVCVCVCVFPFSLTICLCPLMITTHVVQTCSCIICLVCSILVWPSAHWALLWPVWGLFLVVCNLAWQLLFACVMSAQCSSLCLTSMNEALSLSHVSHVCSLSQSISFSVSSCCGMLHLSILAWEWNSHSNIVILVLLQLLSWEGVFGQWLLPDSSYWESYYSIFKQACNRDVLMSSLSLMRLAYFYRVCYL